MTHWPFWGEKRYADIYENIYIRTNMEDWHRIICEIASQLTDKPDFLDIGCGEGHTTKQIADRIQTLHTFDILEPDADALAAATRFLMNENSLGIAFNTTLANLSTTKTYDAVISSHTNYYWSEDRDTYNQQLDKLITLLNPHGRLVLLTLPKESDHYNITINQVFPAHVYSSYITNYYLSKGLSVKTKRFEMRLFIGDILSTSKTYDLYNLYRFIHSTDNYPTTQVGQEFKEKIRQHEHENYLDFRDDLIIVEKH